MWAHYIVARQLKRMLNGNKTRIAQSLFSGVGEENWLCSQGSEKQEWATKEAVSAISWRYFWKDFFVLFRLLFFLEPNKVQEKIRCSP